MENILFLACFFGLPVAMVLALLWIALRAIRGRLSWRRALSSGWDESDADHVRMLLRDLPALDRDGARVDRVARKTVRGIEVTACRYRWSSNKGAVPEHRQGRQEAWLILPLQGEAPRAVVAPRTGGFLDAVVDKVAEAAGQHALDLGEAWTWARVYGPADPAWFTETRGRALQAALESDESLMLHGRHAALVLPYSAHPRILRKAEPMVDRLTTALH